MWEARFELAACDANHAEQARCLDRLLELFVDNPARLLRRLNCLRDANREERIRFGEGACGRKDADPDSWPVDAAMSAFLGAGRSTKVLKMFKRAPRSGSGNAPIGVAAIRLLLAQRSFLAATGCFLQLEPGEVQRRAAPPLIQGLASQFGAWKLLHSVQDVRRTFRRAGKLFHREGAGSAARRWLTWKLHWQWTLLPLASLAVAVAAQPPILVGLLPWRLMGRRNR